MVGRVLQDYYPQAAHRVGERTLLEVRGLSAAGLFREVSFRLHDGEILGFYGLVGSGRTEIMKALFGTLEYEQGEVLVAGRPGRARSVRQARDAGLALVPEDRKREGLVVAMSLADNIALPNLDKLHSAGTILFKRRKGLVAGFIEELSIRPPLPNRQMRDFSGGNQQKAVIAKWLAAKPRIFIFDEPTRGIDVGAKAEIYHLIERLARTKVGIIFVSSELMEIIGMCDRVIVVHEGRITGEFDRSAATQERLMQAAAGF
jgi:ABC-type sugar transport system ATPase subunit